MIKRVLNWFFNRNLGRMVYDVKSPEFHEIAKLITGMDWDFSRLDGDRYLCCVKSCYNTRLWGHWTCSRHVESEIKHFNLVDDCGNLFWSHQ